MGLPAGESSWERGTLQPLSIDEKMLKAAVVEPGDPVRATGVSAEGLREACLAHVFRSEPAAVQR